MKAKAKKIRNIKRSIKKIFRLFLTAAVVYAAVVLLLPRMPQVRQYFQRFGVCRIDTSEADKYYDLLSRHAPKGKGLILDLGLKDKDGLQTAVDRIKEAMGLSGYRIWLAHHDAEKPPAYIKQLGGGDIGILLSKKVTDRREELNLLVHELGHIYVWKLDPSIFGKCDQEKLVDCSGVFLGLGPVVLNGLTDETRLSLEGYETRKKSFGYLKPEQFWYLLARYCAEEGISQGEIGRAHV